MRDLTKHILGRYQEMIDVCKEYHEKKCDLEEVKKRFEKISHQV